MSSRRGQTAICPLTEKPAAFTIRMDNFEEPGGLSACLSEIDARFVRFFI